MALRGKLFGVLLAALFAALPAPAIASPEADAALGRSLSAAMRAGGPSSGAFVFNATDGRTVLRYRHRSARILASNTKLFTTAAALARFGVAGRLGTEVRGRGSLDAQGVWQGDLFLRGGGDPSFGSSRFVRRSYGVGATVEELARRLVALGIRRVSGRVFGDESRFDTRRGGPDSFFRTSIWVGPLTALAYNRGLASESGRSFQTDPARFAAARLDAALEAQGIPVGPAPRAAASPGTARALTSVESPAMARLTQITNKPSDNFFAEMLLKDLAVSAGSRGTTSGGARTAAAFARRLGANVRLADGSGLSRGNRASPYRVTRLLLGMRARTEFAAFRDSLAVAGRDGTLAPRMRNGAARGRCRAKSGTIIGVSALSGYCEARSGDTYAFSILMNGVGTLGARNIQDRMAHLMAAVRD